ncbi:Clp protease N-terminal domain-containing protein [Prauserella oleivorans]|uniref:Clp protease N-terminal domain-containing protein n=1 Tax=Prauserella oleivorans TaxID=1478153 RepID=A0ABW5W4F1_9PSEU
MFERFTEEARTTVTEAVREADIQGAREVDPLHLLVALTRFPDGAAARLLGAVGFGLDDLEAQVAHVRRRGGLTDADTQSLEQLGIDVDEVVARVEHEHGEGALARGHVRRTRKHVPFTGDAKRVLEQSLKEAMELRDDYIGGEHLLLALASLPGPAADVLTGLGADPLVLRAARRRAS